MTQILNISQEVVLIIALWSITFSIIGWWITISNKIFIINTFVGMSLDLIKCVIDKEYTHIPSIILTGWLFYNFVQLIVYKKSNKSTYLTSFVLFFWIHTVIFTYSGEYYWIFLIGFYACGLVVAIANLSSSSSTKDKLVSEIQLLMGIKSKPVVYVLIGIVIMLNWFAHLINKLLSTKVQQRLSLIEAYQIMKENGPVYIDVQGEEEDFVLEVNDGFIAKGKDHAELTVIVDDKTYRHFTPHDKIFDTDYTYTDEEGNEWYLFKYKTKWLW